LLGSNTIEPMAFEGIPLFAGVQLGLEARALVVFHTPPPAAPMKTVQLVAGLQFGATAIAVVRPEKIVGEVPAVDSLATRLDAGTPLGPSSTQLAVGKRSGKASAEVSGEAVVFALVRMSCAAARAPCR
jgi:hypothetical protein